MDWEIANAKIFRRSGIYGDDSGMPLAHYLSADGHRDTLNSGFGGGGGPIHRRYIVDSFTSSFCRPLGGAPKKFPHVLCDAFPPNLGTAMRCQYPVGPSIKKVVGYPHRDPPASIGVKAFRLNSSFRTVSGSIRAVFWLLLLQKQCIGMPFPPHERTSTCRVDMS